MTDAQATVGAEQLKKLDRNNQKRIELANRLTEKLEGINGITPPHMDPKCKHVFHIYRVAEACWAVVISSAEHRVVKLPLVELD